MDKSNTFIDKLILKLKSGDARSIHLDALPGRYARLDLYDLVNVETSLHHDFLSKLLSGKPFSFQIQIDPDKYKSKSPEEYVLIQKIIKRLNHLFYQEQDEFAEMGTLSFGFGYPLLIFRDPSSPARILKAPLLIWYLQIERNTQASNTWTIKRTEEHPILFNEVLKAHIETAAGVRWGNINQWDEDNPPDEKALQTLSKEILSKFNITPTDDELFVKVLPCNNKQAIDNLTQNKPWIRWSGVFGLYKTQKQPIIKDLVDLAAQHAQDISATYQPVKESSDILTPVLLDPSQETVLHNLNEFGRVIIQGPPGTGKSQSISAIVTSALLQGKKILIVCEKRTALEVIKQNLETLGLGELIVLIEDVYSDRNQVVQRIRNQIETVREDVPYFKNYAYDFTREKVLKNKLILNERIDALHQRVFGDDTWIELAERHQQLLAELDIQHLLPVYSEPFDCSYEHWIFNSQSFRDQSPLLDEIAPMIAAIHQLEPEYWMQLKPDIWQKHLPELVSLSREILRLLEKNFELFGSGFYDISKTAMLASNIAGIFSGNKKAMTIARKSGIETYGKLYQLLELLQWPGHALTPVEMQYNMMHWVTQIQPIFQKAVLLEPFTQQLDRIKHWLLLLKSLPDPFKGVLENLSKLPADSRMKYFDEWYFRHFLTTYGHSHLMDTDGEFVLTELGEQEQVIKPMLSEKVLFYWRNQSKNTLRQQDVTEKKMLYNLRKNKQYNARNTLRSLLQSDFKFFTDTFPVFMANPVVASAVLPLQKELFDMIILDEASQLRVEDTYAALYRGKRHVISGDEHQMPPSSYFSNEITLWDDNENSEAEKDLFLAESASLLEYASDTGYYPTYLDFHYRSKHPDLIAFSNAGFYGSRLVPMPPKTAYQSMFFNQMNGVYENGTNPTEAKAIVDFLYTYAATKVDRMPGIGVGTLNIHQRDFIQDMLWEQAYADPEKNRLMEQMMKAGLFVKNLENIQGDERDVIIIGTTFGPDEKGNFRQNFGPLNRQNGYQLLNVLITRAKLEMHVFTTMPETMYLNFEEELRLTGNTGKPLLYAYLSFVRSVAENDLHRKQYILDVLEENQGKTQTSSQKITWTLPAYIKGKLEEKYLHGFESTVKIGGFELEATILQDVNRIYLQTERLSPHPNVHYRELLYRPGILKPFKIETHRIWAYDWWKNASQALNKVPH